MTPGTLARKIAVHQLCPPPVRRPPSVLSALLGTLMVILHRSCTFHFAVHSSLSLSHTHTDDSQLFRVSPGANQGGWRRTRTAESVLFTFVSFVMHRNPLIISAGNRRYVRVCVHRTFV